MQPRQSVIKGQVQPSERHQRREVPAGMSQPGRESAGAEPKQSPSPSRASRPRRRLVAPSRLNGAAPAPPMTTMSTSSTAAATTTTSPCEAACDVDQ